MNEHLKGLRHLQQHSRGGEINVTEDVPEEEHRIADAVYQQDPGRRLRVQAQPGLSDLEFLRFYPHVRALELWISKADFNLEGLRHLQNLDRLHLLGDEADLGAPAVRDLLHRNPGIGQIHSMIKGKAIPSHTLDEPTALHSLHLMGNRGTIKNIDAIADLKQVTSLGFASTTVDSVEVLRDLQGLETLYFGLGSTKDLSGLAGSELKDLSLAAIRQFSDLSFLSDLRALETVRLEAMRNVTTFPNLAGLSALTDITLDGMKGLRNLELVATAPGLRQLTISQADYLDPQDLLPLVKHPSLQKLNIHFTWRIPKNERKEEQLRQMFGGIFSRG
ncbi:hypothetical protein [Kocuria sp.]|uniref:hypothetical protein n=1 Tax=Kocuria sp. TaxID=1871328 RepID=UPI0026E0C53B|nr:hypothetical protein [Kocuria sp.]MDO5618232.1 hypothetical protein [Kocuria sp.]